MDIGSLSFNPHKWSWRLARDFPWKYVEAIVVTGDSKWTSMHDMHLRRWEKFDLLKIIEAATSLQNF